MDFQFECVKAHNELRGQHAAPPLNLSEELCKHSKKLADYLVNKHEIGENTYCLASTDGKRTISTIDAVDSWYQDVEKHNFEDEPSAVVSGRFTQIIWKDTEFLGVGFAKQEGKVVLVANYYPPGNIKGEFSRNVAKANQDELKTPVIEEEDLETVEVLEKIRNDCLRVHNILRERHGAPPLQLKESLSEKSQLFADYLIKKAEYGENTYCIISTDPNRKISGDEPVKSWYNEVERHNFQKEPTTPSTSHFTQVVWKETRDLGVGVAVSGNRTVVVANYHPTGNILGDFITNVLPSVTTPTKEIADAFDSFHITSKNLSEGTEGDFAQNFLDAHNEYRKRHDVEPLELHDRLIWFSQQWAEFLAAKDTLIPRDNCPFGENIYSVGCSTENFTIQGRKPVDFWYDEVKHHGDGDKQQMENYAQVISKVSKFLGVGVAKSKQGNIYVVANYASTKNMEQHEKSNIGRQFKNISTENDESGFSYIALEGLEIHNEYRKRHGAPPLVLDEELCVYAQKWADHLAVINVVQYRPPGKFGENVFEMRVAQNLVSPSEKALRTWYNEVKSYNYSKPAWSVETENFTQMVWKSSEKLGMAMATNKYGYIFIVANYSPRGNSGKFEENVLPLVENEK